MATDSADSLIQWRNPVIASVLHEMGLAETKGSGIRVMCRLMEEAELSPPSFDSDRHNDQFAATYLFHHFLSEAGWGSSGTWGWVRTNSAP
ncbi:MAG: ATP-binding protein [Halomonas sp.]|uniref:ATP-binding protein n=1 Tax=Halomonas sp. TaxID=1486246 RepID=UPI002870A6C1|nr:ATP-binding protein [Halomonas sp.]MDR9438095.1 ATP-binding protein [Halomonas sp.]